MDIRARLHDPLFKFSLFGYEPVLYAFSNKADVRRGPMDIAFAYRAWGPGFNPTFNQFFFF